MHSDALQKAEKVYAENPTIGRHKLARAAGISVDQARHFLDRKRYARSLAETKPTLKSILELGASHLNSRELELISLSANAAPPPIQPRVFKWNKNSFKFLSFSDNHNGHKKSRVEYWQKACHLAEEEKVDIAFTSGDMSDGMSSRPGHIYELDAIGFTAQLDLTAERFSICPVNIEGITGNHDLWAYKTNGSEFGVELENRIPNKFKYLGQGCSTVTIDGIKIMLWHGADGSSYATSYRTQKFVESLSGGEKPHILLSGHAHKGIFHVCRNVMVFECGTLCGQTDWMRDKKIAAHVGFWIIEVWPSGKGGIERIKQEWVPLFTEGE